MKGKCQLTVHPKAKAKMKAKLKGVDFPKQWLGICQEEAKNLKST